MKLILSTKQRLQGTTISNPKWILDNAIHEHNFIKLSKVILPNIVKSYDYSNAYITINGVTGTLSTKKRHKLMSGAIAALNAAVPTVPNMSSFVYSFLEEEGVLRVTYTSTVALTVKENERMGLPSAVILPSGTNQTFDFPHHFSLANTNTVFICINSFTTPDCRSSLGIGTVLGCVGLTGTYGNVVVEENTDESSYIAIQGTDTLSTIELTFRDGRGTEVDMQGEDIVCEFLLKK